jgi:hypothetical protein
MKKRMGILGLLTMAVIVFALTAACQSRTSQSTSSPNTSSISLTTFINTTGSEYSDNPLKKMSPVYFEETIEGTKMKFWVKGDKTRYEMENIPEVYLEDTAALTQIIYSPAGKMAYRSTIDDTGESLLSPFYQDAFAGADTGQNISKLSQQQLQQAGIFSFSQETELWDGKNCEVTTVKFLTGEEIKSWVWKEKGISIRYEMTGTTQNPPNGWQY